MKVGLRPQQVLAQHFLLSWEAMRVLCWAQAQLAYAKAVETFAAHQKATDELVGRREDAYSQLLRLQDPTAPPATQLVASVRAPPPARARPPTGRTTQRQSCYCPIILSAGG